MRAYLSYIKWWFRRDCKHCGKRKPYMTAYCDQCWDHYYGYE